jgi:molybdopterin biosynthesis enzyme
VINGKPLISLPGYPASAIFSFLTFVRPLILWMLGTIEDPQPIVRAKMARRVAGNPGLRTFVRVQVRKAESGLVAYPLRSPGAGILSSFTRANGILTIPEDIEGVDEQEEVEIMLFRPIERL